MIVVTDFCSSGALTTTFQHGLAAPMKLPATQLPETVLERVGFFAPGAPGSTALCTLLVALSDALTLSPVLPCVLQISHYLRVPQEALLGSWEESSQQLSSSAWWSP